MSGLAISKPWIPLTEENIAAIPAQLGVFEIGDGSGEVQYIGYAGGREPFGLRSALTTALTSAPADGDDSGEPREFRVELTHGYLTRWEELLMVHQAMHGALPIGNRDHLHQLGTLTLD